MSVTTYVSAVHTKISGMNRLKLLFKRIQRGRELKAKNIIKNKTFYI